jgi:membrane protein HdeD
MATAHDPATPDSRLGEDDRPSGALTLVAGGLAVLGGIVAILVPALASVAIDLLVGWALVGLSAFVLIDAFSRHGFTRIAGRVLLGLATFAAGVYLHVAPLEGTYTLTVMLVIWFGAAGLTQIMIGLAEWKLPGAGLMALSGVASVVLGVLIANRLPEAAAWAIGLLVGIQLILYGMTAVAGWISHRRSGRGGGVAA